MTASDREVPQRGMLSRVCDALGHESARITAGAVLSLMAEGDAEKSDYFFDLENAIADYDAFLRRRALSLAQSEQTRRDLERLRFIHVIALAGFSNDRLIREAARCFVRGHYVE